MIGFVLIFNYGITFVTPQNRATTAHYWFTPIAHRTTEEKRLNKLLSWQIPNEENASIVITCLVVTVHEPSELERETPDTAFLIGF